MRRETAQLRQWAKNKSSQGIVENSTGKYTTRRLPITLECRIVKSKDGVRRVYSFSDDRAINESASVRAEFEDQYELCEALMDVLEGLGS